MKKKYAVMFALAILSVIALPALADDATVEAPITGAELELAEVLWTPDAIDQQGPACRKPGNQGGDCVCEQVYDPVCGCDGVTYSNDCFASCDVLFWTQGACGSEI